MYGCKNWTIKKAEHWRIDAFELWYWRRLLRVPWTARRSNQSILRKSVLNIHWKDWCLSWSSNNLVTWCEELTHLKRPWCWERLKAGEGDDRGCDGWMASPTQWAWVWARWWRTGKPGMLQSMGSQRVGHDWTTGLNWVPGAGIEPAPSPPEAQSPNHETTMEISPMLFFLNWRIIALQYCAGFCHMTTWINHCVMC